MLDMCRLYHLKKITKALAGVAQWTECQPANQRVAGQVTSWGHVRGNHTLMFLSSFSLLSSFSKNKIKSF